MMKKRFFAVLILSLLFFACASDDVTGEFISDDIPVTEAAVIAPMQDEPVIQEEPVPVSVSEPELDPEPVPFQNYSEEYLRSVESLSGDDQVIVPPEVFEDDKNQIFKVINDLDLIMKKKDFDKWVAYLTPESYSYWSNRHNLLELSRYLFAADDFRINNIREYFEMFFIPARRGRLVDEIRYVTPTFVKVVQYKNKTDIIYYFFEKQGDTWLLQLDTL